MFEAVVTLCLALSREMCREVALPGIWAAKVEDCRAALAAVSGVTGGPELVADGPPRCREAGPELAFDEIAPGVLVHRGEVAEADRGNLGDIANIAVVIGTRSVAVIDSGSARWIGEAVWRAIRARTALPVSHVILTHVHPDHVFGATALTEAGAMVVAHAGLARALADRQAGYLDSLGRLIGPAALIGTVPPPVGRAVSGEAEIDLGGRVLRLRAWPPAHSGTDVTVLDSASGVLFAGDLVFDGHLPALDGTVRGWAAVLEEMRQDGASLVVPGHGGPVLPWPAGGAATARYLEVLARDARAAVAKGERLGDAVGHIAAEERGRWRLFDAFNARNATVAFTEMEWE
ncbi:quinoprotein relay system zinc metallohydrolase 2 [Rhodovulum visakhapatnamense]|uniref:Quinoprotein relay system zinc metallohydrolase 2 n=1 Tax=Rhodovulum visakhapatnamense TaxID=364297 RepID=A0A4R8FSX1_9RHOB|nr:quinoprotein relay system zinc metallohydrolase 2 [Rhodovulum visakhapatnamense]TDX29755.1 quinoprotein relay system zinc metallohydrolase 2 [Rhodovulum visakhapatnamense]